MVAIRIERFAGMLPVQDPGLLTDSAAAAALNVRVDSGVLRGVPAPRVIKTLLSTTKKVYRLPFTAGGVPVPLSDLDNSFWIEFSDQDTDFLRSPNINDSFDRYYWCSPSTGLRYATRAQLLAGNSAAGVKLGVRAPPTALTVTPVAGTGAIVGGKNTGRAVTRSYVTTWVSIYGEESAPSPPAEASGFADQDWLISSIPQPTVVTDRVNIASIRLYRTVTGASGVTSFYYVDQIVLGAGTYTDRSPDTVVTSGQQAESVTWAEPPDMDGIVAMPNGIFVGFKGNTLYFSENYRPHAWPVEYAVTVQHPIVGLGVFGNSCVVCTTGAPAVVTGVRAASMALTQSNAPTPCVSRRSISSGLEGVAFATESGLCLFNPGGARVFSTGFISRDQWAITYLPATQAAIVYAGDYIAIRNATDAFMFPLPLGQEMSGLGGVVDLDGLVSPITLQVDPWAGRALYVRQGQLLEWFPLGGSPRSIRWRSKVFDMGRPLNLGAAQVSFKAAVGAAVTFRVWADGNLVYQSAVTNGKETSLPSGFRATEWQFEVEANTEVTSISVASSKRELRRV
jgi:hypothetical protein